MLKQSEIKATILKRLNEMIVEHVDDLELSKMFTDHIKENGLIVDRIFAPSLKAKVRHILLVHVDHLEVANKILIDTDPRTLTVQEKERAFKAYNKILKSLEDKAK